MNLDNIVKLLDAITKLSRGNCVAMLGSVCVGTI